MGAYFSLAAWLALGAVLLAAAWTLRRPQVRGGRVVLRLPLDGRRALCVVALGGRHLVLGVADGGVSLLTELDERDAAALAVEPLELGRLAAAWKRA